MHIQSICDALDMPLLKTTPDLDLMLESSVNENSLMVDAQDTPLNAPQDYFPSTLLSATHHTNDDDIASGNQQQRDYITSQRALQRRRFAVNLYPAQHLINAALLDVVQYLNWSRVAIIFEGNDGTTTLRLFLFLILQ